MKQGDIWEIRLDPVVGAEIQKTRPALIIRFTVQYGRATPEIVIQTQEAIATLIGYI
jgi:mRNA-degrading endonuclease toxin of MazEF toxin-antitoxin module